jgi:hypothetical protein
MAQVFICSVTINVPNNTSEEISVISNLNGVVLVFYNNQEQCGLFLAAKTSAEDTGVIQTLVNTKRPGITRDLGMTWSPNRQLSFRHLNQIGSGFTTYQATCYITR